VLADLSELADVRLGWRNLIARGCLPSVFQHPGWADAWWRSFGDGRIPFVVVGRDGDSIVGIVPLMVDCAIGQAQFIGHPLNDRNGAARIIELCAPWWAH
jgi:CelD/BcsL family acetyltransferase involved in cellulose biosynthesis